VTKIEFEQNPPESVRGVAPGSDAAELSPRETQLLRLVLEGHPNKIIAQHLGIMEAAANAQLASLLRKISVENRTQAAIWALANLPEFGADPPGFV
jgi:two-component system, NarL family, nitrate/nitrite response regulator NarL